MTPEERQLLSTLADRVRNSPSQQKDPEAEQFLRQLSLEKPDTAYILAQTVIMQDFALRNAQAQITELQRQVNDRNQGPQGRGGSFLGGMTGGGSPYQNQSPQSEPYQGSVPRSGPWNQGQQPQPPQGSAPPQGYGQPPVYGAPTMEPSQTGGFLRSAATTAAGVAGGALLFQGINSLFSGHHSGFSGLGSNPQGSLSETTVVNNYYDDQAGGLGHDMQHAGYEPQHAADSGYQDAGIEDDLDSDGPDYA